jgi:hypothetical protein
LDKLREKLGSFLLSAFVIIFVVAFIVIGVLNCLDIVINVLTIAGWGSWKRGIMTAPFFILGAAQILRGFFSIFSKDAEWFERHYSKKKFGDALFVLYFISTIAGYAAVFAAIVNN